MQSLTIELRAPMAKVMYAWLSTDENFIKTPKLFRQENKS